jgi:hypothetical protein
VMKSDVPVDPVEAHSKWLGGEAHVRYHGRRSFRLPDWMIRSPYTLGLAFLVGGLIGAGLTGLIRRSPS